MSDGINLNAMKHIKGKLRTSSMPYLYDIAEGNVDNHEAFRTFGYNGDVGTAFEDIWEVGGSYVNPTSAMGMELVSSSVEDDILTGGAVAGTGVHKVEIHYLDSNYTEQTEEITLNGQGVVATSATNILRINHLHSTVVGTGKYAVGTIDIRHLDNTPIYSRIGAGTNRAQTCVYTVPAGYTAYIVGWTAGGAGGNKDARFVLESESSIDGVKVSGVFQSKSLMILEDAGVVIPLEVPIVIPEKTTIKVKALSTANSAKCTAAFYGWIEQ